MPEPLKLPPDIEIDTGTSWEDDSCGDADSYEELVLLEEAVMGEDEEMPVAAILATKQAICAILPAINKVCKATGSAFEEAQPVSISKALSSPCKCLGAAGRDWCFVPGMRGMLKPEQVTEYCSGKPIITLHNPKMKAIIEAREAARKAAESCCKKGDRMLAYLDNFAAELRKRKIE